MRIDLTAEGLRRAGFELYYEKSYYHFVFDFWKSATGDRVQSLVGAELDWVLAKSAKTPGVILKRYTKTDGGAGASQWQFEGTVGGDKIVGAGSTTTRIVVDSTTGMAVDEHLRIGLAKGVCKEIVDGTHFDLESPLEAAPATGLTVYRGFRARLVLTEADVIAPVDDGHLWVFVTLPTVGQRQAWFYGPMDVLPAPVPV